MTHRHMRALRRDQYQCQHRDARGLRCLEPAPRTRLIEGALVAVCEAHS